MNDSKLDEIFGKEKMRRRPRDEEPKPVSERLMAAEDVLKAIKDDDAESLDAALEDHYAACQEPESDAETVDSDSDSDYA
jgi:hypothetical protein